MTAISVSNRDRVVTVEAVTPDTLVLVIDARGVSLDARLSPCEVDLIHLALTRWLEEHEHTISVFEEVLQ